MLLDINQDNIVVVTYLVPVLCSSWQSFKIFNIIGTPQFWVFILPITEWNNLNFKWNFINTQNITNGIDKINVRKLLTRITSYSVNRDFQT